MYLKKDYDKGIDGNEDKNYDYLGIYLSNQLNLHY